MKVYQTDGGYYFKEYKNGKKVRISQEQFLNFKKNAKKSKHSRKISKKCCKKMKGGVNKQQLISDLSEYTNINGTSNLIQELNSYDGDIESLYLLFYPILANPGTNLNKKKIINNMTIQLKKLTSSPNPVRQLTHSSIQRTNPVRQLISSTQAEEVYNNNLIYKNIMNKHDINKYFIDIQKYTLDTNRSKYLFLMEKVDILEHNIKKFNLKKKSEILYKIFDSVNELIKLDYIYSDLKLVNIGYIEIGGTITIKLIDVGGLIKISDIDRRSPPITLDVMYFAYISIFEKTPEQIDFKVYEFFNKLFPIEFIIDFINNYKNLNKFMKNKYIPDNYPKLIINEFTYKSQGHEQGSFGDVYLYDKYALKIMKSNNNTANASTNNTGTATAVNTGANNTGTLVLTDNKTSTSNNYMRYIRNMRNIQTGGNKKQQIDLLLKGMYRLIVYQLGLVDEYDKLYQNINNNNYDNLLKSLKEEIPNNINLSNNVKSSETIFTNSIKLNNSKYVKSI